MVEKSEVIRSDIEQTRSEMGDTLDALGYKANVPARTKSLRCSSATGPT